MDDEVGGNGNPLRNPLVDAQEGISIYAGSAESAAEEGSDALEQDHQKQSPSSRKQGRLEEAKPFTWVRPQGFEMSATKLKFDSLNYERSVNSHFLRAEVQHYRNAPDSERQTLALRWVATILLGVLVGLTAALLESMSRGIVDRRNRLLDIQGPDSEFSWAHYAAYIAWNAAFVGTAAFLAIWWAPGAIGSGIPDVIAYLNGVRIENVFTIEAFITKLVGTAMVYSSGLMIGPEGPLVHLGGILGSILTSGNQRLGPLPSCEERKGKHFVNVKSPWLRLCNDLDRRDFITMGGAAGFAAAFGAPVGGVLFAVEEAASFVTPTLMWRTLCCVLVAQFVLLFFSQMLSGDITCTKAVKSLFIDYGLINLKGSEEASLYEFPLFIIIGIVGSLFGVLFNQLFVMKMKFFKTVKSRRNKFLIIMGVSVCMSIVLYAFPEITKTCRDIEDFVIADDDESCTNDVDGSKFWVRFGCEGEHDVNVMASMFFGSKSDAIQQFMSFPYRFSTSDFIIMFFIFQAGTLAAFCTFIPTGIFVPTILNGCVMGALLGRAAAQVAIATGAIEHASEAHQIMQHAALFGAVGFLGGVLQSTVSLCIIITEGTGQLNLLIPIIITTIVSKTVANYFQPHGGLYDHLMELKSYPHIHKGGHKKALLIQTKDLISKQELKTFRKHTTVREVVATLRSCKHNGFPVITSEGSLEGLVLREALYLLLEHHTTGNFRASNRRISGEAGGNGKSDLHRPFSNSRTTSGSSFGARYDLGTFVERALEATSSAAHHTAHAVISDSSNRRTLGDATTPHFFSESDLDIELDLEIVMNQGPCIVLDSSPASHVVQLFTSVGLRHAVVIDRDGIVVGILTRCDILELEEYEYVGPEQA